jgi:hypothetical protein
VYISGSYENSDNCSNKSNMHAMNLIIKIVIIFTGGYEYLSRKWGDKIYYKFAKRREKKLQKCKVGFL